MVLMHHLGESTGNIWCTGPLDRSKDVWWLWPRYESPGFVAFLPPEGPLLCSSQWAEACAAAGSLSFPGLLRCHRPCLPLWGPMLCGRSLSLLRCRLRAWPHRPPLGTAAPPGAHSRGAGTACCCDLQPGDDHPWWHQWHSELSGFVDLGLGCRSTQMEWGENWRPSSMGGRAPACTLLGGGAPSAFHGGVQLWGDHGGPEAEARRVAAWETGFSGGILVVFQPEL